MRYTIVFSLQAEEDLLALRAHERAKVLDVIEIHLSYEPEKESQSRIKRLQGYQWPKYRLRFDELRVFYDVLYRLEDGFVEILMIGEKAAAMQWLAEEGIGGS
ncbi:MAG: type II toxin-antitoxin system RelE/ParE family toxin [Chloroflexota bacterium]|nr:type II toxin-antitoxin system RelE/ParE family toxin [Chloroflexota bacterium]